MPGEKTEQPTQKRRSDARKRGQVAVSRELDSALALLAALLAFRLAGPQLWAGLEALLTDTFIRLDRNPLNSSVTAEAGTALVWRATTLLLPLVLAVAAVGVLGGVAQTGGVMAAQAVKPQAKRLNPLQGAKRVFASKQAALQLAKSLVKFIVIGGIGWWTLQGRWHEIASLGLAMPLDASLGVLADIGFDLTLRVVIALLLLGVGDLLFQRYDLLSQLKMSRQEVKDELRQSEGDPQIRAALARQRRNFLNRVLQEVPRADVVLTNPTHYAIALKYDPATSAAPVVIAKGQDLVAQRIREVALEHGIPVIQNPPLTRAIHRAVPIGKEIPPDLYEAVAEILAFVYRLRYPGARAVA